MPLLSKLLFAILLLKVLFSTSALAGQAPYRVLVVMSYSENYLWSVEIREGIEQYFGDSAELIFFYLNTKMQPSAGADRAAEAWQLYLDFKPDGVIAADDNAQSMFVVPYLRNRVATPVMFCGVNAGPERYGYPAKNVSGILERYHLEETIAFNRLFDDRIKRFIFMARAGLSADMVEEQLHRDLAAKELSAELVAFLRPKTRLQALEMVRKYRDEADLLIVETLQGVTDKAGKPLRDAEVLPEVFRAFGKASASNVGYAVAFGALAAVVKTGQEQGRVASKMLHKAMRGMPLKQLPVTRNYRGQRIVNVTTMRALAIKPSPIALHGAKLVRNQ